MKKAFTNDRTLGHGTRLPGGTIRPLTIGRDRTPLSAAPAGASGMRFYLSACQFPATALAVTARARARTGRSEPPRFPLVTARPKGPDSRGTDHAELAAT
jgi:hypothetical protein